MRWQLRRGVLAPPHDERPGSPWWRAVNERLLRDGCEAVALIGDRPGPASSRTVEYWTTFADRPTARTWYRAHNASVAAAYLEHRDLAEAESAAERFFMNVVLCRVLYTHALVAAPRMSLGWLRPLAPFLGDPRLGMTGIFLQLSRVLPDEYPLTDAVDAYLSNELGFGRLLDFGVILPRLQQIYEWSADVLDEPGLRHCARDGAMIYAWPFEERGVWRTRTTFARAHGSAVPPAGTGAGDLAVGRPSTRPAQARIGATPRTVSRWTCWRRSWAGGGTPSHSCRSLDSPGPTATRSRSPVRPRSSRGSPRSATPRSTSARPRWRRPANRCCPSTASTSGWWPGITSSASSGPIAPSTSARVIAAARPRRRRVRRDGRRRRRRRGSGTSPVRHDRSAGFRPTHRTRGRRPGVGGPARRLRAHGRPALRALRRGRPAHARPVVVP